MSPQDALRTGLQGGLPTQRKGAGTAKTDQVSGNTLRENSKGYIFKWEKVNK